MSGDNNPFLDDDDDEPEAENKSDAAFAQMRKTNKQLQKELEDLRAFKAEQEKVSLESWRGGVRKKAGVDEKVWAFYRDLDSITEPSDELASTLISKHFGEGEQESSPSPEPTTGFTPTIIPEGALAGGKVYDLEEFEKLARMDPRKAAEVYKAGRIKKDEPWGVGKPMTFEHGSLDK